MLSKVKSLFRRTSDNVVASVPVKRVDTGIRYRVTVPGQEPVVLRAKNKVEVKAMVREALGLNRLPAGTVVERDV